MDGLVLAGALAHLRGGADNGAQLVGAGEHVGRGVGGWAGGDEQDFLEATVADLIAELGDERYARAFAEGQAMSLDDAIESRSRP